MVKRLSSRSAFGKKIIEYSIWNTHRRARTDIEMNPAALPQGSRHDDKSATRQPARNRHDQGRGANMALKIIDQAIQAYGGAGVSATLGWRATMLHAHMRLADGSRRVHNRAIADLNFGSIKRSDQALTEQPTGRSQED